MEQCEVTITSKERLSADIVRLTLLAPSIVEKAQPGQFINVKAGTNTLDPLLRRPFSIHQTYSDGTLQIVFKILGKGTEELARVSVDETLNVVGPLGNAFTLGKAMCLIGGGLGIAPLLFLAKKIRQSAQSPALSVILGARTKDELLPLANDFTALGITPHLATDDGSLGHHGLVTDLMKILIQDQNPWQICTCGPYPMMKQIASISRSHGWNCQVSLETMMACGIKACLGCTVLANTENTKGGKYLHVCQDGPVFCEGEIAWQ
ncbi:MAG: dihydroorotate dehydrogenase electron transfer subunit [Proteobacteria bacterium]|nr:dihydroorotate dehydrogenase electron transfer subunit [Desulfobulbaceae bacterium]MBU4151881.1 dihydroorotate dehydrogenase electron transfer subunit [Pseudomonadota bacterium]MDP2106435.1 dihydroorotate dehydrogenase electron transfer subunit [Desulfobulbaceae bacterium]